MGPTHTKFVHHVSYARFAARPVLRAPVVRAPFARAFSATPTTDVPDLEKQVEGLEKREIEAIKAGRPVFASNEGVLTGPFGTRQNPVKGPSAFSSRIVGCTGGPGDNSHDLLWHEVPKARRLVCLGCGQYFELEKVQD